MSVSKPDSSVSPPARRNARSLEIIYDFSPFPGCVSGFKTESRSYNLMKDSVDKSGLGTCDVCSNHQCLNQGICQEAQSNQGYSCICQPGYSGEYCDKTREVCTPGRLLSYKIIHIRNMIYSIYLFLTYVLFFRRLWTWRMRNRSRRNRMQM